MTHTPNLKLITGLAYGSLSGAFTCSMTVIGGLLGNNPDACTAGAALGLACLAVLILTTAAIVTITVEYQAARQTMIMTLLASTINSFCERYGQPVVGRRKERAAA